MIDVQKRIELLENRVEAQHESIIALNDQIGYLVKIIADVIGMEVQVPTKKNE